MPSQRGGFRGDDSESEEGGVSRPPPEAGFTKGECPPDPESGHFRRTSILQSVIAPYADCPVEVSAPLAGKRNMCAASAWGTRPHWPNRTSRLQKS